MAHPLFTCAGGSVVLPDPRLILVDRAAGGNLVVLPPRPVWERSELTPQELRDWSYLVAATGRAMIDTLPQLEGGCINYWEAGNWALNDAADPPGPKRAPDHRSVHLHLLGRSPKNTTEPWVWGEAPLFPKYAGRFEWSAGFQLLTPDECRRVVTAAQQLLAARYGMSTAERSDDCPTCGYPRAASAKDATCPIA